MNRVDGADAKHTGAFLISAGADRKVRFWDLSKAESSSVVSGLELEEPRPTFVSLQVSNNSFCFSNGLVGLAVVECHG